MQAIFERIVSAVLAVCAVLVTVVLVRREFFSPQDVVASSKPRYVKGWRTHAVSDQRLGTTASRDTILVFSDFQCPFCRAFFARVDKLAASRPSGITVLHRNFPITTIHPVAYQAAMAATCAAAQGRFQGYHAVLFARQDSLGRLDWKSVAEEVGVPDIPLFTACLGDPRTTEVLTKDSVAGAALGLRGTPMVIVNGWFVAGALSETVLGNLLSRPHRN